VESKDSGKPERKVSVVDSQGWLVPSCDLWCFGLGENFWFAFSWSDNVPLFLVKPL